MVTKQLVKNTYKSVKIQFAMMSTSQDEIIELIDINSNASSQKYNKRKYPRNKVGNPPIQTPSYTSPSRSSEISDVFLAKSIPQHPVPKPRRSKQSLSSPQLSEGSSTNYENNNSKYDQKSYRDKIKERFKNVKQHAGKSATKIERLPRLKGETRRIINLNKSIEAIKRENFEIESDIKRRNVQNTDKDDNVVSRYDKYAFFCEENIDDNAQVDGTDGKCKSNDQLVDKLNVKYQKSENLDFFLALAESEILWIPSNSSTQIDDKFNADELRDLSEEGFYVPEEPQVRKREIDFIERRLLNDDKKWFDCRGALKLLENPRNSRAYRPITKKTKRELTQFVRPTFDVTETLDSVRVIKESTFDIHVHSIKFNHHPLFSVEHVLCDKLIRYYDIHREHITRNNIERITKKIDALQHAVNGIEETLKESGDNVTTKKLKNYRYEMRALNEILVTRSREYRENVKLILETWKNIKKIREMNNYSSTTIKLLIRKEKCDYDLDKKNLKRRVQENFNNELFVLNNVYVEKMRHYKLQMEKRKDEDEIKPNKPTFKIDGDSLRDEIESKFKSSLKPPGEPLIFLNITHDNEITSIVDDAKEKLRRTAVSSTKIHFKFYCDDIFVCKSKTVSLNDTFTCIFDESISIYLSREPECFLIEIYEQPGTLLKRKIGTVTLSTKPEDFVKLQEAYFNKEEILHYNKHTAIGSGIELDDLLNQYDLSTNDNVTLNTSGFINFNLSLANNHVDNTNVSEEERTFRHILKHDGTIDIDKLRKWTQENTLDPQDPKNSLIFEYIANYPHLEDDASNENNCFRLDPDLNDLSFCHRDEIDKNIRFKVLELRDRNEPEFVGVAVPNRIKEIPTNILSAYKKRVSKTLLTEDYDETEDLEGGIESRRSRGFKNLKLIYAKIFQEVKCIENNLEYEDVVNETLVKHVELSIPLRKCSVQTNGKCSTFFYRTIIRTITYNVLNWFKLQPSISKPLPKLLNTTTNENVQELTFAQPKIIINVISGINVPKRCNDEEVQPFVSVTFDEITVQSTTSNGTDPLWDETLTLPLLQSSSDLPNNQEIFNKFLIIQLFDQTRIKINMEEINYNRFLGSVRVPISAISATNKISGSFKLDKPSLLFGYDQENARKGSSININEPIHINLTILIEPNVPKIHPNLEELPSSEPPYLRDHILNWNKNYNVNYPSRKFTALVLNVNGKSVCVTRYIKPLEPPQINRDGFDVTAHQCARFVSSIPFTESNYFYDNIWLTTDQMLKLHFGTIFDHAVALTCYLIALNMNVWLTIGFGLPNGITAYVLVKERNRDLDEIYFYDVLNGNRYDLTDPFVPIQSIFCVINGNNMWANLQNNDNVTTTRYDFNRRSDWSQLFNADVSAPTNTTQSKLNYWSDKNVDDLEKRIEKRVRKKIMNLRKFNRTIWNHSLSALFKKSLRNFEYQLLSNVNSLDVHTDIRSFLQSQNIYGFVINVPFKNINTIVDRIKSTGIHLNIESDIEYVSSIHLHTYSNHVIVVWFMIGIVRGMDQE